MSELKDRAERSACNLRKHRDELAKAFSPIENNTLRTPLTEDEVDAHKFFVKIVETSAANIGDTVEIMALCVEAHDKNNDRFGEIYTIISDLPRVKAEAEALRQELDVLKAEHDKMRSISRVISVLWSGKAIAISTVSAMALAAYNVITGNWG